MVSPDSRDTGEGLSRGTRVDGSLASLLLVSERTLVWKSGDRGLWRPFRVDRAGFSRTALVFSSPCRSHCGSATIFPRRKADSFERGKDPAIAVVPRAGLQ